MAIIYYPDYKEAAERHFETCLQLEHILKEQYQIKEVSLTLTERKEKMFLLSNLYYLSGYVIECIYNYAIFRNIGFPSNEDVKNLKYLSSGQLSHGNINCEVAFRYNKHCPPTAFIIADFQGHRLSGKMNFFLNHFRIANASKITLINGNSLVARPSRELFQEWDVYKRYKIEPSLNLDYVNIFDFFDLAVEVYEGVIRYL